MSAEYNFDSLVGKTITSVDHHMSDRLPGLTRVTLLFSDGDELELYSRGCDEGGWMEVSGTDYDVN